MNRQTIDYGIDLGTTNSEIACVDLGAVRPLVIENNYNERITPSVVGFKKGGQLLVGKMAYNMLAVHRVEDFHNVQEQFKRRMGTDDLFDFSYNGTRMRPEELSAEVLKELKNAVATKRGEQVDAAVITIPAAFEQPQIAATKKAATLAGFVQCELLNEPVAAALAYGFLEANSKGYWLVYDLGGGTFDVALLRLQDGIIQVANHCGDNYLGGKDIDNMILDRILMPRVADELGLDGFGRGADRWKYAASHLRYYAEMAKIELTKSPTAELHLQRMWDPGKGDPDKGHWLDLTDMACELTRDDVMPFYQEVLNRSLNYCKDLLKQSRVSSRDVEKLILVGGPTHFPMLREGLKAELGIPLDYSQDPMTVVAQGAAVFGSTRRRLVARSQPVAAGVVSIDLEYEPSGADPDPSIGGLVKLPRGQSASEFSIELVQTRNQWRSGKNRLTANGAFLIIVHAEKGANEYRLELCDASGSRMKTDPETVIYSLTGLEVQAKILMHDISIGQADGSPFVFFEKGKSFPLKGTHSFKPVHEIKKGTQGDALVIRVFEGTNRKHARRMFPIGEVRVSATEFPRNLPENAEIEVRIELDENGGISGGAEVMLFDQDEPYPIVWSSARYGAKPNMSELERAVQRVFERMDSLRPFTVRDSLAADVFARIEAENTQQQIEETLRAATLDNDAATKCEKLVIRLNEQLDEIDARQARPQQEKRALELLDQVRKSAAVAKVPDCANVADRLCRETDAALKNKDDQRALDMAIERLEDFYWSLQRERPEFWLGGLTFVEENRASLTDQAKAVKLLAQARKARDDGDGESLKATVVQLVRLLPREVQEKSEDVGNVWKG